MRRACTSPGPRCVRPKVHRHAEIVKLSPIDALQGLSLPTHKGCLAGNDVEDNTLFSTFG